MRYLMLFCTLIFLFSCGTPPVEESIIGKWSYDHVDFKATANNEAISDYDRESIAETAMKIKSMELEFYNDKTFDLNISKEYDDISENGNYTIEGDGKYIATTKKDKYGNETNERLEIVRLTSDSLTLISAKGAYVVYSKVK